MRNLKTLWSDNPDTTQYPRPQMARDCYQPLDGEWDYLIRKGDLSFIPDEKTVYDGKINVPFSPECMLSGVNRTLMPGEVLVYRRKFPRVYENKRILLHFGAVDYECRVYLNSRPVARHIGGYTSFEADITDVSADMNELVVCVTDPSDSAPISRGKQSMKHGGIWYTPSSGIWQSVWAEYVPAQYIQSLKITPDIDAKCVTIQAVTNTGAKNYSVRTADGKIYDASPDGVKITMQSPRLWTPEDPYLYTFEVMFGEDKVSSYYAMRKFSVGRRKDGKHCFMLNNKPYFMTGLLDQGYWSDGLYTAPSDEALVYDIELAKKCGFNTLRKHIKIEPMRWYYHCDRLGMIVWQDFVNGGGKYNPLAILALPNIGIKVRDDNYAFYSRKDAAGRQLYYDEMHEVVSQLYNCPCIALWTPFNEGWGQFDSLKVCEFLKTLDNTRLIDHASGWSDQGGELRSIHKYFVPFRMPSREKRPVILTEYGGYSLATEGHTFDDKIFGYAVFNEPSKLNNALFKLFKEQIIPARKKGLCAAIYTQLSDVQSEVNGLVTYDRQKVKVNCTALKELNDELTKQDT